jgi:hypothetical protein
MIQSQQAQAGDWPNLKAVPAYVFECLAGPPIPGEQSLAICHPLELRAQAPFEESQASSLILHKEKCNERYTYNGSSGWLHL